LREQWLGLGLAWRVALVAVPVAVAIAAFAVGTRVGVAAAVLLGGAGVVSIVYVKNRTDRHNAAVERGEIGLPGCGFQWAALDDLPAATRARLVGLGMDLQDGRRVRVARFAGGWLAWEARAGLVLGDDGGWARFDPRVAPAEWAACEYLAGRGHDG
jgi:hypothetical protein